MAAVTSGEVIAVMLSVALPVIGLGGLVWYLSAQQARQDAAAEAAKHAAAEADKKAELAMQRTSKNADAIAAIKEKLASDYSPKSEIRTEIKELETRLLERFDFLINLVKRQNP